MHFTYCHVLTLIGLFQQSQKVIAKPLKFWLLVLLHCIIRLRSDMPHKKLIKRLLPTKPKPWVFLVGFAVIGGITVYLAQAASPSVAFEVENASKSGVTTVTDATASAGSAIQFGSEIVTPPTTGTLPTAANTGPRYALTNITPAQFLSSGTCNRQRITGDIRMEAGSRGETYNLTDCEINGTLFILTGNQVGPLSLSEMPTINMDYVDVTGSIQSNSAVKFTMNHSYVSVGSQMALQVDWNWQAGPFPGSFSNSVFHQVWEADVFHSEALHVAGWGTGLRFTNVAFVIDGGNISVGGYTATINFHATEAVFDGCYFLSNGTPATYVAAAIEGANVIVKNSWLDDRIASVYTGTNFTDATYQNNKGYPSGNPLTLP